MLEILLWANMSICTLGTNLMESSISVRLLLLKFNSVIADQI